MLELLLIMKNRDLLLIFLMISCSSLASKKTNELNQHPRVLSIKPTQQFNKTKAIIDQKLSYFCYQSKVLKHFKTEESCNAYVNLTYRTCMDKNDWKESEDVLNCINRNLKI